MANEIKQKIKLEGEKEYSAAIKNANRNIKTLQSAMKAETAELGKNATAQQKAEVRSKSLQKQIAEQETVVKTLKTALEEVREKYGDNEDEVAKWEQKLNAARTTLANMKNDLDSVGGAFKSIEDEGAAAVTATNSVAESLQRIADMGGAIADGISSGFSTVVSAAKDALAELWEGMVDLAARSNNLTDLAGFWNTSATEIQKYQGAVAHASGTLEDLNAIVTKINSMDSKKIAEVTGVSKENYQDLWEYSMAVMDALSEMGRTDPLKSTEAGFELFGKSATKALDLVNDWGKVQEHLNDYDPTQGGYGLTEEQINTMSDLYDKVNGLKASWQSLKDMGIVELAGSLAINLTGNAQAILDGFLAYFNADSDEDRAAAIESIAQNITEAFETIKKAIQDGIKMLDQLAEELKNSDDPTAKSIGNILGGLVDALQWIVDNQGAVLSAMYAIAAFWVMGKGLQMATTIGSLVKDIALIKLFGGLGAGGAAAQAASGAAGAAGAAGGSAGSAAASGAAGAGGAAMGKIGTLLTSTGAKILGGGATFVTTLFENAFKAQGNDDIYQDESGTWRRVDTGEVHHDATHEDVQIVAVLDDAATALRDAAEEAEELLDDDPLLEMSERQREAAEDYWDAMHQGSIDDQVAAYRQLEELFQDEPLVMDQLMNLIDSLTQNDDMWSMQDLPDWWFGNGQQNQDQITSSDLQGFRGLPASIAAAVQAGAASGVSGIRVTLDGSIVGQLVAPYVSQEIASRIM